MESQEGSQSLSDNDQQSDNRGQSRDASENLPAHDSVKNNSNQGDQEIEDIINIGGYISIDDLGRDEDGDKESEQQPLLGKRSHNQSQDDKTTVQIKSFQNRRRVKAQQDNNKEEQDRFETHLESFGSATRSVVESVSTHVQDLFQQFIASLPGQKPKLNLYVSQIITSTAKIFAGQLVEHAKQFQIQEIKNKIAIEYPHELCETKLPQEDDESESNQELSSDENINQYPSGLLSNEGLKKFQFEVENNLGPLQPQHLRQAYKLMMQNGEYISEKPKSMFLKK